MSLASFLVDLAENPMFSGLVGGSLVATLVYTLREIPSKLWKLCILLFTSEVTVHDNDGAFDRVSEWLSRLPIARSSRRGKLATSHAGDDMRTYVGLGFGKHFGRIDGRLVQVERQLHTERGARPLEAISIRTLGGPAPLHAMLEKGAAATGAETEIPVFLYKDYWRRAATKPQRNLDSVFLPEEQKRRIVADLERFSKSRSWYEDRGLPYRRGILLDGPPGTGKTSLVIALAGHLRRPIYALNLGSLKGDEGLIDAVMTAPSNCVLLIEDIDAAETKRRTDGGDGEAKPISLSALLNAIDGVFSRDGRILAMTTNHPEKVDPALLRPGRVDVRETLGPISGAPALRMCERFLGDEVSAARFMRDISGPVPPAELQERLLRREACS